MAKTIKKQSTKFAAGNGGKRARLGVAQADAASETQPASKQNRVIALLRSPSGATLAAMMKETEWQQHSVRGFLAGVVRKKLKLKLASEKVDGTRIYRIGGTSGTKRTGRQHGQQAA